ncbi:DNA-binding response regulator [Flavobacterium album]|uniref:DNA-binding response regulator n=1 Tax=Flavobacterium album TaxID=2175091 RepID=A0A2S1QTV3_9FLAO|nr:LytTR family DNA-binding domain-containing protein [Flavobacterium album]AWH83847.1 DNA-binding response regulator [Flavobacterium album]
MKLTCILVDDEPPAIRLLEKYVERIPFLEKLAVFSDSLKALEFLNATSVDVIFLDIQMPQLTGLQLSKILPESTKVIFTTAYPDFALEGFDLNATDYLLKPIAFERFYKAVSKLSPENKTASAPVSPATDYLFIKTDGKNKFSKIFLDDILYVEALQNYVSIHKVNDTVITHSSLKNILDLLPANDFIQIHRSYAVAVKQIDTTDSFSVFIKKKELPLGNTYKDAFFKRIGDV